MQFLTFFFKIFISKISIAIYIFFLIIFNKIYKNVEKIAGMTMDVVTIATIVLCY